MSFWEELLGMLALSACRDEVKACRLLGEPAPVGYNYLWGGIVWGSEWPEGLWASEVTVN